VATHGTPRITWHGKDFAATTEIVKLGDVEIAVQVPDLSDPWLRRFYAALVAHERIERANPIAPAHVLELFARRYLDRGGTAESWHQYETELGVTSSKTRPPRSPNQPVMKWTLGGRNDSDGRIGAGCLRHLMHGWRWERSVLTRRHVMANPAIASLLSGSAAPLAGIRR
jgi:hypothetical protein